MIFILKSRGVKSNNPSKGILDLKLTHEGCTGCLDVTILNDKFVYYV